MARYAAIVVLRRCASTGLRSTPCRLRDRKAAAVGDWYELNLSRLKAFEMRNGALTITCEVREKRTAALADDPTLLASAHGERLPPMIPLINPVTMCESVFTRDKSGCLGQNIVKSILAVVLGILGIWQTKGARAQIFCQSMRSPIAL